MEEFLESRCEKLRDLIAATALIKGKNELKDELMKMRSAVSQLSTGVDGLRRDLEKMREQNIQCNELSALLVSLDRRICHMESNVPTRLIEDYNKNNASVEISIVDEPTLKEQEKTKDCKKILFDEPEICPIITPINEEEFLKIPKYIIGRQSLETLNGFLGTINQTLKSKYEILAMGKQQARKHGELNLYLHYKKQELDLAEEGEGIYFFTGEDYEKQTKSKLNKLKLNLLTVLRHCKRLREYRVKNDLRYIVVTKSM